MIVFQILKTVGLADLEGLLSLLLLKAEDLADFEKSLIFICETLKTLLICCSCYSNRDSLSSIIFVFEIFKFPRNFPAKSFTVKVALHLRWLTAEKFENYETVKGGCIPIKNKFKTQKFNKLRWLASDINFKLPHPGDPNAHGKTREKSA